MLGVDTLKFIQKIIWKLLLIDKTEWMFLLHSDHVQFVQLFLISSSSHKHKNNNKNNMFIVRSPYYGQTNQFVFGNQFSRSHQTETKSYSIWIGNLFHPIILGVASLVAFEVHWQNSYRTIENTSSNQNK